MHVLRYGAESQKRSQCIRIGNACIKIWSRKPSQCIEMACIKIWSREPVQCIKIGNACIKIWNRVFLSQFSGLCDFFRQHFLGAHRPRV